MRSEIYVTPTAWLRPHYALMSAEPGFGQLAPLHQFARLVAAIAPDYPRQAALMSDYNDTTQRATLGHLQKMQAQQPLRREERLWTVTKGDRTLRCVIVYLPSGADLRLLEDGDFRWTVLFRDGPELDKRQAEWRTALEQRGWALVSNA